MSKRFGVSYSSAARLIQTEHAKVTSDAQKQLYSDLGVESVELVCTLDSVTCPVCGALDGKVIKKSEMNTGVTVPPFHPRCRCTTAPYYEDMVGVGERAARDGFGPTYRVPEDVTYPEWKKQDKIEMSPQPVGADAITADLTTVKKDFYSGKLKAVMTPEDFAEFSAKVNSAENRRIYEFSGWMENGSYRLTQNDGSYDDSSKELVFSYSTEVGIDKYSTLAHELGHKVDHAIGRHRGLHFSEIDVINNKVASSIFPVPIEYTPSCSDEFLTALRSDMNGLQKLLASSPLEPVAAHGFNGAWYAHETQFGAKVFTSEENFNASSNIQDALAGFFPNYSDRIGWGHDDSYYNWFYDHRVLARGKHHELEDAFRDLGFSVKDVKKTARQYDSACETWANVHSALTVGGKELELMKKYMPNTVEAYKKS